MMSFFDRTIILIPCLFVLSSSTKLIDDVNDTILTTNECQNGSDCEFGYPCILGRCDDRESCRNRADLCSSGMCCSNSDCRPLDFFFQDQEICSCITEDGISNYTCLSKVAINEICYDMWQCPPNARCSEGRCVECDSQWSCTQNAYCSSGQCRCFPGYKMNLNKRCIKPATTQQSDDSVRALEIYKITMIFASCLLALVLVAFLYCIIKKSFCGSRSHRSSSPPDIMTLFAESASEGGSPFGVQPPFEKPPSYDESQNHMREIYGVPPPSYPGPSGQNDQAQSNQHRPSTSRIDQVRLALSGGLNASNQVITVSEVEPGTSDSQTGIENSGFSRD